MPLLQNLPEDCVRRILYYLGGEGIVRVHEVNQALRCLARAEALRRMRRRPRCPFAATGFRCVVQHNGSVEGLCRS